MSQLKCNTNSKYFKSQKVTKVWTQKSQNVYNLTVMHWKPFQSRLLFEWDFVSDFKTLYNLDTYLQIVQPWTISWSVGSIL